MQNNKPLWLWPWKYKESIISILGLFLAGSILQFFHGNFPYTLFIFPNNLYAGGILFIFLIFISVKNNRFVNWITGIPFSVTIISFLMILTLIMGLTPQLNFTNTKDPGDWLSKIGFRNMTSSWGFVLIYISMLISLGSLIIVRMKKFKWKDYAFHLNHIGLFIILLFGGLGASDIKRFQMYVEEGQEQWQVFNSEGKGITLPIAIKLNDFIMEEYAPKLTIVNFTGKPLPEKNPQYFQIENKHPEGILGEYEILIKKYIQDAVKVNDSTYQEIKMTGSCPAALVRVRNTKTNWSQTQWISSGSLFLSYQILKLPDNNSLVMTQPEPKKFLSDIVVYTPDNKSIPYKLEVNKPLKIDNWTIYQYGYNENAGKYSHYSSFELVYDPWVNYVYLGIVLLGAGCLCLLWKGNKKMKKHDLE